jgi:hypothetical protein
MKNAPLGLAARVALTKKLRAGESAPFRALPPIETARPNGRESA